jgi:hypothetical protein
MAATGRLISYETLVGAGGEAARFDTAFFQYLERNASDVEDGPMMISSQPEGEFERKTVVLWSPDAVVDFINFWRGASHLQAGGVRN